MDFIDTLIGIVLTLIGSYVGSLEWRMREMDERLRQAISKEDIIELIDMKQESMEVMQKELKDDIKSLDAKLDKLIDRELDNK